MHNNIDELDAGNLNGQWVALEALGSVFPLLKDGFSHDDIAGVYPISSWRENTVEVPIEILDLIVSSWNEYHSGSKTLGQSFGFEKVNRQGSRSMKAVRTKIDETLRISNKVLAAYIQLDGEDPNSLENAISVVAADEGISESKAERAYRKYGQRTLEKLKVRTSLDFIPGKTSRTTDVDE
ncbi:hypothetical protein N9M66_00440 [Litoreibacter sp.]|nr:hypothetical protein [Litoreibacter sp.]